MQELDEFIKTIKEIRDKEKGCIWNLKQSHGSLKRYLLEELYEALEAIDAVEDLEREANFDQYAFVQERADNLQKIDREEKAFAELKEELGDLLLQIVLHSRLAEEKGFFDFADVAAAVDEKMIRRHPHVFQAQQAKSVAEVDEHWDKEKAKEKAARKSIFEGVAKDLPALAYSWKISKKAVKESFEWDEEEKLYKQLLSEIDELKEVVQASRDGKKDPYKDEFASDTLKAEAELELGDVLFTVVNIARWFKIDPEDALRKTNNKFVKRFDLMMELCQKEGKSLKDYSPSQMEDKWQQAKQQLRAQV